VEFDRYRKVVHLKSTSEVQSPSINPESLNHMLRDLLRSSTLPHPPQSGPSSPFLVQYTRTISYKANMLDALPIALIALTALILLVGVAALMNVAMKKPYAPEHS